MRAINGEREAKMRLQNKIALLTGAAAIKGQLMGFGGAAAHLFVREGAKVVLTNIRDDLGERAAAALRAEGLDARYLHLDVTSEQNWPRWWTRSWRRTDASTSCSTTPASPSPPASKTPPWTSGTVN
jgi:NAD(P)-dependent dehydrogenase (short-subunit alcohol dehydrogenase family)